jgi:uncharacterized iron-regulated membrane protein
MDAPVQPAHDAHHSAWRLWLDHPEKVGIHRRLFQFHLWVGMGASAYIFLMSLSGSLIVFRNQLETNPLSRLTRVTEWAVNLHENLLAGYIGRTVNGIGAACLVLLCLTGVVIWWPGIAHWRRSLRVSWKSSFAHTNWELHNSLGFWCLLFVLVWGVSGAYFVFPNPFNSLVDLLQPLGNPPQARFGDTVLLWLANLHIGRFNLFSEIVWSALGLIPAVLSFTGFFMCCHRIFVRHGRPLARSL